MPEDKTFFDVERPDTVGAHPTSKPVIVGHHPTMPDPMVSARHEQPAPRHHSIQIKDESDQKSFSSSVTDSFSYPRSRPSEPSKISRDFDAGRSDDLVDGEPLQSPPFEQQRSKEHSSLRSPEMPISSLTGLDSRMSNSSQPDYKGLKSKKDKGRPDDEDPLEFPAGSGRRHKPHPMWWLLPPLIIALALYAALDSQLIPNSLNLPFNIFKKSEPISEDLSSSSTPETSSTTEPITTASQIPADWTAYENKDVKFKFAYPKEYGTLAAAEANNSMLLHIATSPQQSVTQNLSGRLDFGVWKKDTTNIVTSKYGPTVKPVVSATGTSWTVAAKGSSDLYPQKVGDKYEVQVQTANSLKVYNFSYSDDGCSYGRWIVEIPTGFADLTLPGLCTMGSVSAAIPTANQQAYLKTFTDVAGTFTVLE